ncbi:CBL-interacting serine/threonine-protein kinase 14-like [Vicia villosa]|uniref:CBL-interacting serine/threonine-protein kinase 14-like n=1 Tax=Vicia villosa TaxID=3911 RepID=UPI00273AAB8E|nr:CBL-interacting serine/threonine-protein kinase 14-like [Vicia villosa]
MAEESQIQIQATNKSTNGVVLFEKYEIGKLLGVGASAKVHHATNVETGKSVAVKVMNKKKLVNGGFSPNIEREISILSRLHHPNIVNLFEVLASKTKIYFIIELASAGELFEEVAKRDKLTEEHARKYFRQLISAVKHCHSHGVYHRDLKLDNLLLDENDNLKVTDFGLSAVKNQIRPDGLLHTVCGTPSYVAPEILAKKGYNGAKADVWSCGVVLFAITAGYLPFNDYNITVLYRKIYRGQFRFPKWFSCDLKNLLSRLLDTNPETRISVDEILQDPWFNSGGYKVDRVLVKEPELEESQTGFKSMNAFDLISFSTGLDMSGLFEDQNGSGLAEWVVSRDKPEKIIERVEEVVKGTTVVVTKMENCGGAKLEGQEGNLIGVVMVYRLTDEFVVVEMKKRGKGEESEAKLWKNKLRPLLVELAKKPEEPVSR